ncbi:MAG: hydrogen peroxide-inducible genes activator [Alphaproteobacteria bacterium]|nr:hydrogen peroxide-inducible genes activator [Alphaproteobacteria bacterium]
MLPTLRQLEYVVALADAGQFVEAARQCAVSQPALSKQIREVEELLGTELFERARPRVLLTPVGEEVVRRARQLLVDAHELVDVAGSLARPRQGTLRLGVIPTIAPYGLPGLLAGLRRRFPDVAVVVEELQTPVLLERLRAGGVDLALLARAFDDHGLDGRDLVVEPFVLVAPEGHPLATSGPVRPLDLAGASMLLMEDGHCLRDQAIDVCATVGDPPPTSVAAASVSTLVRMVESGLGPTLLPASALATEVRPGQGLVVRRFADPPPGRTLTLQWRATSPSAPWFAELAQALVAHYRTVDAGIPEVGGARPRIIEVADARHPT